MTMQILIQIKRQENETAAPYLDEFLYEGDGKLTIADFLSELNEQSPLRNKKGDTVRKIKYESSCHEKKCGACAMVINGRPALACSVFLCNIVKSGKITIEPLSKFPVVCDLVVDRKSMFQKLETMRLWLTEKEEDDSHWDRSLQYSSGQCMMCGLCLEICPNYRPHTPFAGAASMVHAFKMLEQNEKGEHLDEIKKTYAEHFLHHCSQSLSCQTICPAGLPLGELQSRANHWERKKG